MSIEKILITGASGYLAQFIIDQLHSEYQLTLTDLVEPDRAFANTTFIKADVTNAAEIEGSVCRAGCRCASRCLSPGTLR